MQYLCIIAIKIFDYLHARYIYQKLYDKLKSYPPSDDDVRSLQKISPFTGVTLEGGTPAQLIVSHPTPSSSTPIIRQPPDNSVTDCLHLCIKY